MIREVLSEEVTCGPHGLPGRQRPRLRAQEVPSLGGSILGTAKRPMWPDLGQRREKWEIKSWKQDWASGQVLASTVGTLNAMLREVGTQGLRWERR